VTSVAEPITPVIGAFTPATVSGPAGLPVVQQRGGTLLVRIPWTVRTGAQAALFALYSAKGRLIGRWKLAGRSVVVHMQSLPSGVYFGQVIDGENRYTQKMLWAL
jgi:hypothetical protein